jgi:hypothetical protein
MTLDTDGPPCLKFLSSLLQQDFDLPHRADFKVAFLFVDRLVALPQRMGECLACNEFV